MSEPTVVFLCILGVVNIVITGLLSTRFKNNGDLQSLLHCLLSEQQKEQHEQRQRFDEHQLRTLTTIQDSLKQETQDIRLQLTSTLSQQTNEVNRHLTEIGHRVNTQLNEGFKKTNETFFNITERLTIIDQAQKKITELSDNVVSLQAVLTDKRSRGTFGEVQLNALIRNMLPEQHFALQHELSNKTRVDCLLFLPEPTGNIALDAKFPLENFKKYMALPHDSAEKQKTRTQFSQDIRKHIKDVATKYILPGETADGAVLFIPAEAIFAEIHGHFPELVETAHQLRVWLVSPTTLMAILTTARAVIKDTATRKQVHIIQDHLFELAKDFQRFQERMNKLSTHIDQAQKDVEEVHKSSRKITNRFNKIEQVEIKSHDSDL